MEDSISDKVNKDCIHKLNNIMVLSKKYPNNMDFGKEVRAYLLTIDGKG